MLLVFGAVPGFTSEQTKRRKAFHSESIIRLWRTCEFPKNKCGWSVKVGGRGKPTAGARNVCVCVCVCACVRACMCVKGKKQRGGFTGYKNNITRIASHFYFYAFIFLFNFVFIFRKFVRIEKRICFIYFADNSVTSLLLWSRSGMIGI